MDQAKKVSDRADTLANRLYLNRDRWKNCERRVPRAQVEPALHSVRIVFKNHSQILYKVCTIGELGAFCVFKNAAFKAGQKERLSLLIANESFDLEASIRYVLSDGFGVEFVQPPETVREKIRTLLGPEFLAATLTPCFAPISMEPGSTRTLIYSDGDANYLHISLADHKMLAVDLELAISGLRLLWRKAAGNKLEEFRHGGNRSVAEKVILSFLRNLPGLAADYLQEIESVLTAG
jgi:hypothetical protein